MSIPLRPYSDEYKEAVRDFVLGIQRDEFGVDITYEQQPDLKAIPAHYQKGAGNFWLALEGDRLIGTTALIDAGDGVGILRKMFVAKEFRGKEFELGQTLLETAFAWSRAHGITDIYLGTIPERFRAAVRFYEKNGFAPIPDSALPECVTRIRMPHDTQHYHKPLTSHALEQAA